MGILAHLLSQAAQKELLVYEKQGRERYLEDLIHNRLLHGEAFCDVFGIPKKECEELYQEGFSLYREGVYSQATEVFTWLVLLDPWVKKSWMGLGATQQMEGLYTKALRSYGVAAFLDDQDPAPHYYASQCYTALGEQEEAKKAWEDAQQREGYVL